jgi:hypothetical protein
MTPQRQVLLPLALAQFICSFAGSNMNVMINDISHDLDTTVQGVQVVITLFLLTMAALMIPGGKLTDKYGRKRCFLAGLTVYGIGALMSAAAPGLGILILGNSIFEGVGTALLIPPVYILTTLRFNDLTSRQFMGLLVMAEAINRAKSTDGEKIREALVATDIPGEQTIMPWKRVKFDEFGQNNDADPVLLQYIGGKFVTIFPPQAAIAEAVWPMK